MEKLVKEFPFLNESHEPSHPVLTWKSGYNALAKLSIKAAEVSDFVVT